MMAPRTGPQRIERLTPVADVLARIDRLVLPVEPRRMALDSASGRVLAADVRAPAASPAAPVALCDGWAVSSEATVDAGPFAPAPIAAVPIQSGEPLPPEADAVAPSEAVILQGQNTMAVAPVAPGDGILLTGIDAGRHELLGQSGYRLRATDLAAMAALGVDSIDVREPEVRIVPARRDDAIIAAIAQLLGRIVQTGGARPRLVPADARDLAAAMTDEEADAVVVIGGSGSGVEDISVHALAQVGRVEVHGVGLTPGETSALGFVGRRPVLVLPGRVDAAVAGWLVLGAPMLGRLCGAAGECVGAMPATLAAKITSSLGLAEVVPVRREDDKVAPLASGYLPLQSLLRADGWILVPPDSEGYAPGSRVTVRPLP
ncbi:MAG TPA: molybdopterin-binding protein [Xanthobacteraceae bacterium]|nr:molybdopterin-binding protein [Xanthobacteraceae bacterium]